MCGLQRLEVSEDAQCALTTVWDRFMHWDRMFLALHNMSNGADTVPTTYRARPRGSLVSSAWGSLRAALVLSLHLNLPCARPSFPVDMASPGHIPSRSFPTASRRRRLVYTALDDDAASAAQQTIECPTPAHVFVLPQPSLATSMSPLHTLSNRQRRAGIVFNWGSEVFCRPVSALLGSRPVLSCANAPLDMYRAWSCIHSLPPLSASHRCPAPAAPARTLVRSYARLTHCPACSPAGALLI